MSMNPDYLLPAICLYRESRSNVEAMEAVAWVLRNRMNDTKNRWPKSLTGVVVQPWQFSSFNKGDANYGVFPGGPGVWGWSSFVAACAAVDAVMTVPEYPATIPVPAGVPMPVHPDPTFGANHYHDYSIPPPVAAWLGPTATLDQLTAKRTAVIGPFSFYRL